MEENSTPNQEFNWLLDYAIEQKASDIHLTADSAPNIRVDGQLRHVNLPPYSIEKTNQIVTAFIGRSLYEKIMENREELDFSFSYRSLRFRANVFYQKGVLSASLRILPNQINDFATLGIAPILSKLIERNQGLIIIDGPTGHGKSTTLASMVDKIAADRHGHIITIEDPIEYIFEHKKSIISQREVGMDTPSFASALRASLREDPDVVMVGEIRDLETVEAVLQLAETGHLVLTSLHTNSAAQTTDRLVSMFPIHQQNQIRQQLSEILLAIISQRLMPRIQGGRVLASEVLIANAAVRSVIREGKTHQLTNLIQTSASEGMVSMEKSLADLVSKGEVSMEEALTWAVDPKSLKMLVY